MIVVANWRLDSAKSSAAMLQEEKTARMSHMLRIAGARYAGSHAVHTYIPQVGYQFCIFDMLYVRRENTVRRSSTAKTMKIKPTISERENKSPSPLI